MKRTTLGASGILLATLVTSSPLWAQAPGTGIVYEGSSAPGAALGDSRAEVNASYGTPNYCQSVEVAGDYASCAYSVTGGGQVDVRYRGADGGNASNASSDVVHSIRWYLGVDWITSAGISAAIALDDPQALLHAYPNAKVTYHSITGEVFSVVDTALGIDITRWFNPYSNITSVHAAIFAPSGAVPNPTPSPDPDPEPTPDPDPIPTPDPAPEPGPAQQLEVTSISLSADRLSRGKREITALVSVSDGDNQAISGATVLATWTYPNGKSRTVQAVTGGNGSVTFELSGKLRKGWYGLTVTDVVLDGYEFDESDSALEAEVYAK